MVETWTTVFRFHLVNAIIHEFDEVNRWTFSH